MELLAKQLYLKANELLLQAKDRRNWGSIGGFTLDSSELPIEAGEDQLAKLRRQVEQLFIESGEPGIFILFLEREGGYIVEVGRTNENE